MDHPMVKNRLRIAAVLTFIIMTVEGVGGYIADSLALIGDASHMLMDTMALSLAWLAIIISEKPSTITKSYGYHRAETFAALVNGLLLLFVAGGILVESVKRFWNPREIDVVIVLWVGSFGLVFNLIIMFFLSDLKRQGDDLNVKSAFLHVLSDSLASAGVIVGTIVIHFTGWYQADAAIGIGIGVLILRGSFRILSDSVHILLEGVPKGISLPEVRQTMTGIPSIEDVHELHIWCICSNIYALSAHALIDSRTDSHGQTLLHEIRTVLKEQFNIVHSTIQLESVSCGEKKVFCDIKH